MPAGVPGAGSGVVPFCVVTGGAASFGVGTTAVAGAACFGCYCCAADEGKGTGTMTWGLPCGFACMVVNPGRGIRWLDATFPEMVSGVIVGSTIASLCQLAVFLDHISNSFRHPNLAD